VTQIAAPDFAQLKSRMKSMWTAGDFGQIANYSVHAGVDFVARTDIKSGAKVLDVACGTGNVSLPAARAGAAVTGVDIAPNLLDQARKRASAEKLNIRFDEGDAEDLPYPEAEFDIVLTMFGAMFAPRPEKTAAELIRVCRPGGLIAMANWTPQGFVGKTFQLTAKIAPPPPGVVPPVLWGDEATLRQRFSQGISKLTLARHTVTFEYPFSPKEVVAFFRQYFGPTQTTFARLDKANQELLTRELETAWIENNQATDGTTKVEAEYLDVRAIRA
jgi:ubiquinone/menaquinone biosynthesis C-methylase UbiE